ncbi:MAG: flippase-like domain-containing protein [Planctomycetota bacterium]|nr:flippase-like domain-containing protein [Planctomycetota bacterium]
MLGRKSWKVHRVCFALALLAYVIVNPSLRPGADVWRRVSENWGLTLLGFGISFTQPLWGALRLHRLLEDCGFALTRLKAFCFCLAGSFFNIFLPGSTGGDAYRVYALSRDGGAGIGSALATISLDRLLGLPSLILVILFGMTLDYRFLLANRMLAKMIPFVAAAGAICLFMVFYLAWAGKSGRRRKDAPAAGGGRLRRLHNLIAGNVKRPATLPLTLFYGGLAHLATIASCQCFGEALGISGVPWMRYYLLVPMAMAINSIPGAPGGVGQGELAMASLLDLAAPGGDNSRVGVALMLLFRSSNMAIGLTGGIFHALGGRIAGAAAPAIAAGDDGKAPWP